MWLGRVAFSRVPRSRVPGTCSVRRGGGWWARGGAGRFFLASAVTPSSPPSAEDVLESYENPPPIVLPSEGFQVNLEADCPDAGVYQQLLYLRHFLWSLRSKPSPGAGPSQPGCLEVPGLLWL